MEIRDPIHGSIHLANEERPIIEHPFFQRLRSIKQLGFSEYIFPGATHTRYLHSLGVMEVAGRAFDRIFKTHSMNADLARLRETVRLACLLHDIGHAPLSHTTEFVMPPLKALSLKSHLVDNAQRKATHEDYTIKAIIDSSFSESFKKVENKFGIDKECVAELIYGHTIHPDYFIYNNKDYFPLLHQLVSSEMDCDRMDYLLRDSYFCGVSYGKFDLDWILDNLMPIEQNDKVYIGISERAIATFDDFLLSRFHMFLMVYFHYKAVCLEKLLFRFFSTAPEEYKIPGNIDDYLEHDDHYLMKVLRTSDNHWAKRIVNNQIPLKIFESFGASQANQMQQLESYLSSENIDYIKCSSQGRLSKYYTESDHITKLPLKVVRKSSIVDGVNKIQNIDQATDLYDKFSQSHSVNRIHCDYEELSDQQKNAILKLVN